MAHPRTINFYKIDEAYGCFSNFSHHPVELDGKLWPTTEHYFQAQKFIEHPEYVEMIRQAHTPGEAKRLGSSRAYKLRTDWESVKDDVMYRCVLAKFLQHADIQQILLDTGDANLVEHTTNDSYWGDGGDGSGKNMLGRTLMRVREAIRSKHAGS